MMTNPFIGLTRVDVGRLRCGSRVTRTPEERSVDREATCTAETLDTIEQQSWLPICDTGAFCQRRGSHAGRSDAQ